jgi:hypothetical protein
MNFTVLKRRKWTGGANPTATDGAFDIYAGDLKAYSQDSQRAASDYVIRRRNTRFERIIRDLKENGCDYIVGGLLVLSVMFLLVYAIPAMAAPMTCTLDYHTGNEICQ